MKGRLLSLSCFASLWLYGRLAAVHTSFVVDLGRVDANIRHIKDIVFLQGFGEPTIAVLHEPLPSWTG